MSNSDKKRPRRSFATGTAPSTNPQHGGDGLRYDGQEVPVLIRLPDLSPQALLRKPAEKPQKPESPAMSMPTPTTRSKNKPPTLEHSKPVKAPSPSATTTTPTAKPPVVEAKASQTTAAPSSDEPSSGDQSNTTTTESTPATAEGSSRKRRRRNRGGRNAKGDQRDKVQSMSPATSRRSSEQQTTTTATTNVARKDRNILPFDPSPLIIVTGLLVVAGLTYVVMTGGDEEPTDPVGTWSDGVGGHVVQSVEEPPEPEAILWPPENASPAISNDSTLAYETSPTPAATAPVPDPVWPIEAGRQPVNSYDSATIPPADYSYNTAPNSVPTHIPDGVMPRSNEPTLGWPTESLTPAEATSTAAPVSSWPEAAMAAPNTAPSGRYASQPARYTESSRPVSGFPEEPAARTGRLETGPYPGRSLEVTASPGSQLNGTIEIPRPRANYEYNGSSVY